MNGSKCSTEHMNWMECCDRNSFIHLVICIHLLKCQCDKDWAIICQRVNSLDRWRMKCNLIILKMPDFYLEAIWTGLFGRILIKARLNLSIKTSKFNSKSGRKSIFCEKNCVKSLIFHMKWKFKCMKMFS